MIKQALTLAIPNYAIVLCSVGQVRLFKAPTQRQVQVDALGQSKIQHVQQHDPRADPAGLQLQQGQKLDLTYLVLLFGQLIMKTPVPTMIVLVTVFRGNQRNLKNIK